MSSILQSFSGSGVEHHTADLHLADRRQIDLAEEEMPGLMELRRRQDKIEGKLLEGARISGCLHMTVETAVLIETLTYLGAEVRWSGCNPLSTQDQAAAAVVIGKEGTIDNLLGSSVFAWRGQSDEEYWWCVDRSLDFPDGPTMILDDGADATLLVHYGVLTEKNGAVPETVEDQALYSLLIRSLNTRPDHFTKIAASLRGSSEETTTGIRRLEQLGDDLLVPVINVNDSVTKSKFDNIYGCRHSVIDGLNRATDVMIAGKTALVCGFGDVGKGTAEALRGQGARVLISEVDPICALQAAMQGYQVVVPDQVITDCDIIITATGNRSVISAEQVKQMKQGAILGNIGHFDLEIDVAGLKDCLFEEIKDGVEEVFLPSGNSIILLSGGRLLNLGNATGHPAFVMSASFTNQVLAQLDLFQHDYEPGIYLLDRRLDEEVARLHLDQLGAKLTELTEEQADYIGVPQEGPFKSDSYRY